jgi:hypothetical protein
MVGMGLLGKGGVLPPKCKRRGDLAPTHKLFCYHSVNALADGHNINDLEITQVRFGGDIFLKPWSERFAELVTRQCKQQRKWDEC